METKKKSGLENLKETGPLGGVEVVEIK